MGEAARWQQRVKGFVLDQIGDPPARVLEVGCGKGNLAVALDRAGYSVTAIDLPGSRRLDEPGDTPSENMTALIREIFRNVDHCADVAHSRRC